MNPSHLLSGGDNTKEESPPPSRSMISPYLRRSDDWLIIANIFAVVLFGIAQYLFKVERTRKGDPNSPAAVRERKGEIEAEMPEGMMNMVPNCYHDLGSANLPWRPYVSKRDQHHPHGTVFNYFDNREQPAQSLNGPSYESARNAEGSSSSSSAVDEILNCQYCENFTVVRHSSGSGQQPGGISVSTRIPAAPAPCATCPHHPMSGNTTSTTTQQQQQRSGDSNRLRKRRSMRR